MPNLPWQHRTIVQLNLIGSALGSAVVNVHHFEASTAAESTLTSDAVALTWAGLLADEWLTTCKTNWLAAHTPDYKLNMVTAQVIERPATFRHKLTPVERPLTSANTGTGGIGAENLTVAAVYRWRTPIAGKRHRGRTYVGPLDAGWQADGRVNSAGTTALTPYLTIMHDTYHVGGTQANDQVQTIYSRPYNQGEYQYATRKTGSLTVVTPGDYAGNSTNVTTGTLDTILRSQRRREVGVGA